MNAGLHMLPILRGHAKCSQLFILPVVLIWSSLLEITASIRQLAAIWVSDPIYPCTSGSDWPHRSSTWNFNSMSFYGSRIKKGMKYQKYLKTLRLDYKKM